jgi:hypothetical protein
MIVAFAFSAWIMAWADWRDFLFAAIGQIPRAD